MSAQPFPRRWQRFTASHVDWRRSALLLVLACSAATAAAPAAPAFPDSPYVAELDADNAWLPRTLGYQQGEQLIPVLAENVGLNFTFTDFRLRNKFYREENRHTWGERQDPRFVTEPRAVSNPGAFVDGAGGEVKYQTSYASVARSYVLGADRLTIQYDVTPLASLRIHEPGMFGIVLHLAPGWNRQAVVDVRGEQPAWLWATTDQPAPYSVTSQHIGPVVLVNESAGLTLLLTPTAPPAPARGWDLAPAEQPWRWAVELQMYRNDDPALAARMTQTLQTAGASGRRAYLLVGVGRTLMNRGELAAAEAALLESARLDAEFPTPYVMLAAMRRDYAQSDQWDARLTQAQAWTRAGYRQPYNYGYILSGSAYWQDARLSEAQRRQAIFNLLIAVENATFYSDYYIWGSRPFVAMGMYSQACAMLRQALWSLDHLPRPPAYKAKVRAQLEKQLAELERKLLTEEAVLPPLVPVEPEEQ